MHQNNVWNASHSSFDVMLEKKILSLIFLINFFTKLLFFYIFIVASSCGSQYSRLKPALMGGLTRANASYLMGVKIFTIWREMLGEVGDVSFKVDG